MKVKSFYGNSIKDALDKARRDLGPDASIVASRQLRPEEGGGCEVVCGIEGQGSGRAGEESRTRTVAAEAQNLPRRSGGQLRRERSPEPFSGNQTATKEPYAGEGRGERLTTEAAMSKPFIPPSATRQETENPHPAPVATEGRARRGLTRIRKGIEALVRPGEDGFGSEKVLAELLASGFNEDVASDIVAGVRQRQRQGLECPAALRDELSSRLRFAPHLGPERPERRVVAFVGPPGAGKTTTLVKLAVRYGLRGRKPMHIISMDSWRIGGTDALRAYASGMGVTFEAVETAEGLRQALEEHAGKGLVLIDTPGIAPAEGKAIAPLAALLSSHSQAEVQLVLPAYIAPPAMASLAQRFRAFLPSKILFTSLDCVDTCLPAAALALSLDKPLSFFGTGQIVPEDIEEANATRLLGSSESVAAKESATSAA